MIAPLCGGGETTFRGEKAIIMMKGCIIQLLQNARSMLCHYIETKRHANIYLPRHTENFQTLPRHTYPINVTEHFLGQMQNIIDRLCFCLNVFINANNIVYKGKTCEMNQVVFDSFQRCSK